MSQNKFSSEKITITNLPAFLMKISGMFVQISVPTFITCFDVNCNLKDYKLPQRNLWLSLVGTCCFMPGLHDALFLGKYAFQHVLSIFGFESVGLDDFASKLLNTYLLNIVLVFNRKCKT